MIIKDVITTFIPNPLIGPNIDDLGTRFPDMSKIFSKRLIQILHEVSEEMNINLVEGIYAQYTGQASKPQLRLRCSEPWVLTQWE